MRLHREGTLTILLVAGLGCVLAYPALKWLPAAGAAFVVAVLAAVLALVIWFFRKPFRPVGADPGLVLSPCDGKVVVVEEVTETEYFNDRRIQVSVFMSPLNVHINFNPVTGTARYRRYHKGKYLVAWHPKSSTDNERATVVIADGSGTEVLIRQIAGALARRICTYPQPGDQVRQGEELGFIKFGSRVDLFLPTSAKVRVQIGDKVRGAITPIAKLDP